MAGWSRSPPRSHRRFLVLTFFCTNMRRRALLGTLSLATTGVLSGCTEGLVGDGSNRSSDPDPLSDYVVGENPNLEPYPRFHPRARYLIPTDLNEPWKTGIALERSAETITPEETITFTLTNEREAKFYSGFYHWELLKRERGRWFRIAPRWGQDVGHWLNTGHSHRWTLYPNPDEGPRHAGNVAEAGPRGLGSMMEELYVPGLGSGTYAFGITGGYQESPIDGSIALVSTFELSDSQLSVKPTSYIVDEVWEDDTLVATAGPPAPENSQEAVRAYRVERLESEPADSVLVLEEQLWEGAQWWDAIALSRTRDARSVKLIESDAVRYPHIPTWLEGRLERLLENAVEFDGEYYRIERSLETSERSDSSN